MSENQIEDLAQRMQDQWESANSTSIGGASISTALVLLLTQIELTDCLLRTSFILAASAIPIWLALWQVGHSYSIYKRDRIKHFLERGVWIAVALLVLAGATTFISLFCLILHFSCAAAISFAVSSLICIAFVASHHSNVRSSGA